MLTLLRESLDRLRQRRLKRRLRRELDIAAGTRISLANIESMFPHLVHIGKNCIFAPTAMIITHDASFYPFTGEYRIAPVTIGDNVFVGYGALIMPGVTIGDNVVIGAGSVVTKDVPSDCVVAGVPARVITPLPEYLESREPERMFVPPYAGKTPAEVTTEDVHRFRGSVYAQLGQAER